MADSLLERWVITFGLIKQGIPWSVIKDMQDEEVLMLSIIASEMRDVQQEIASTYE